MSKNTGGIGFLYILLLLGALLVNAEGGMELSDPFAPQRTDYTYLNAAGGELFGSGCALSENVAVIGMSSANSGMGGCVVYKKTTDTTWKPVYTNATVTAYTSAGLGKEIDVDGDTIVLGGPAYGTSPVYHGMALVIKKNEDGVWGNEQQLLSPNEQAYGVFGAAVAVKGNEMAVGASGENSYQGAVHIFTNDGIWKVKQEILSPDSEAVGYFGSSVSMDGDLLAVGAYGVTVLGENKAGAVYIFKNISGTWTFQQRISGVAVSNGQFGVSLSLDGNRLLVGAQGVYNGLGTAYIYEDSGSGFVQKQEVYPQTGALGDNFGKSVSLDGDVAVIGAPKVGASNTGATYVFQIKNGVWEQSYDLPAHSLNDGSHFGFSVAIKRDRVLAGALGSNVGALSTAGRAFGYSLAQTQKKKGAASNDHFGMSIGISETYMAAGAPGSTVGGKTEAGTVYLYRRHGRQWNLAQKITEPTPKKDHRFGSVLNMTTDRLITSAPFGTYTLTAQGRLYIYERTGNSWSKVFTDTGPSAVSWNGLNVAIDGSHAAARVYQLANGYSVVQTYHRQSSGQWIASSGVLRPAGGLMHFGVSIAIKDDLMVIGANLLDRVYVYRWNDAQGIWSAVTSFTDASPTDDDFGVAVALSKDRMAVGAPKSLSSQGLVTVYTISGNTLTFEKNLFAPDGTNYSAFGCSVAFGQDGKSLLIGSRIKQQTPLLANVGGAYVFRLSDTPGVGWYCDATVSPPDDGSLDNVDFWGTTVAACGETMVVGTWGDDQELLSDVGSATIFEAKPRVAPADFDSDGITDIGCYDAQIGQWFVFKSGGGGFWTTKFGYAGTTPFVDDFDGDWKADFGCFDSSSANWFGYDSTDGFWTQNFGNTGYIATPGDFDGDGLADQAVFDPSSTMWFFNGSSAGIWMTYFGDTDGAPVTGDFDGDGIDDFGTYIAANGQWRISRSRAGVLETKFGYPGTVPITGDFDGDGIGDFGVFNAPDGAWIIFKSRDGLWTNNFGYGGTLPVTGDFDGDGIDDFGCYYPPVGAWYVYKSTEGFWVNNFGYSGTVPMN